MYLLGILPGIIVVWEAEGNFSAHKSLSNDCTQVKRDRFQ